MIGGGNADAAACVAFVGSIWEQPRYPLHIGGVIGSGDEVLRNVMLLPGVPIVRTSRVELVAFSGDVLMAELKSERKAKPRNQRGMDRTKVSAFIQLYQKNVISNAIYGQWNAKYLLSTWNLILDPPQQRHPFGVDDAVTIALRVWIKHLSPFTLRDLVNSPCLRFTSLLKELLVVIEASAASLREVEVGPQTGNGVRSCEHEEYEVRQIVEHDGCQEGDAEVGHPPDDDGYSSSLGSCRGREDLSWNQPDRRKPTDTESA